LKKILTIILLLSSFSGFSQSSFYRFGFGVQGGVTTAYTGLSYEGAPVQSNPNAEKSLGTNKSIFYGVSADYYITPFLSAGLEYNMVELKDGPDQYKRQFVSNFSNIEIRGNVAAGQFLDNNYAFNPFIYALRNLNLSLGLGIISGKNNVLPYDPSLDNRANGGLNTQLPFSRQHPNDIGKSEFSTVFNIPTTIGYRLNLYNAYDEAFIQLGINYKMVFTFSDDIDGYNDNPAVFQNNSKDVYTSLGISIKYLFGSKGIFYK